MNRYFIAVEIPEKTKEDIFSFFYKKLDKKITGKFVDKEKLHITLLFLGDFEIKKELIDFIKEMKFSIPINIKGIGAFPSIKNPKTIYARVHGNLNEQYEKLCSFLSMKKESNFTPHVTLCRAKQVIGKIDEKEFESNDFSFIADSLHIFNSDFSNYYRII